MAKMLTRCPVCESKLGVSELSCSQCNTRISGTFETCRFCQLPAEHLAFIETFLRCEGNISRVEKEMGLSYPTVRNRLSAALSALHFGGLAPEPPSPPEPPAPPPNHEARRREALEALSRGELSAEEAAVILRELN